MSELVKINPQEYGLDSEKAKQIENLFSPMLSKMTELESQYNEIINLPINLDTCKKAKELRLQYVKVRTGTAAIHKEAKAFYLAGGRFVDGWKNAQLFASQGIEDKLSNIENYFENIEKERIEKLRVVRWTSLSPYVELEPKGLGEMDEDIWFSFFSGCKSNFEAKKEAELKAEQEKLQKEKEEKEVLEKQRLENERLRKINEDQQAKIKLEQEARLKAEQNAKEKEEEINKLNLSSKPIQITCFDDVINQLKNISFPKPQNENDAKLINNVKILIDKTINYINTNK